ncbi:MAG: AMP-binding protein [Candidatus Hydrogenedens sp.]|nr:AMP-binding protein [Candidatus Hydrogenedens sp.]
MAGQDISLLWQCLERWVAEKPDAEALVYGDRRVSWRELSDEVERASRAFLEAGVQKGDRVAMVAMACPEFVTTYLAASKVGAIWLGLNPKFSVDELRYILGHSEPSLLFTLREYQGVDLVQAGLTFEQEFQSIQKVVVIGEAAEGLESYESFVNQPRDSWATAVETRAAEVSPDDETLLMYTSGSTGRPKGVLQSHRAIIVSAEVEKNYMASADQGRMLLHFPINHVAADVEIGYTCLLAGGTLVLMDRFDPQESLEVIERERITMVGQVPVMFLMQFQAPKFKTMDWSSVKSFVWGGSGASPLLLGALKQIASATGANLVTGYGSTELCGFSTYSMPEDSLETLSTTCGKVVPPFEMKIVDAERNTLPPGEVGEIAFRGPIVMKGYFKNPTATAEVLDADGWYYTNDLGRMDENGYLSISGRRSEMFKTGGENVFPREVEDILEVHASVLFSAVVGIPHEVYDEVGHAFIMLKPGMEVIEEELRLHCKERLANFKVPKSFDIRPILPLLPNGKVNKMALKRELGLVP